jgi:hypothetical protein
MTNPNSTYYHYVSGYSWARLGLTDPLRLSSQNGTQHSSLTDAAALAVGVNDGKDNANPKSVKEVMDEVKRLTGGE